METTQKTKADLIVETIDATALLPMVTPRFGNNWKESTLEKVNNGDMTVEDVIHIAFLQGRKAILLEEALRQNVK